MDYSFKKRKLQTIVVLLFLVTMVFVEISTAYADDHVEVQPVGTLPASAEMGTVLDLVLEDGYAYLAAQGWGLHIINISNPSAPGREWSWTKGSSILDVDLAGNWCYIAASYGSSNSGLYALDTTVTTSPFRYHRFGSGTNYSRVCCGPDNKVYAARGSTLEVVYHNESGFGQNPMGSYTVSSSITGIDAAGDLVYIVGDFGLRILDASVPGTVVLKGRCENLGTIYDIDVAGNYAYLANGSNGLRVIDISDPTNPVSLDVVLKTNDLAVGVAVSGSYAFIADNNKGLTVVDVSVPASPSVVASYDTDGTALKVRFAGGCIYLADGAKGMKIFRLNRTPVKPVNSSPVNGVEVSTLTPLLQASAFTDADDVYGDTLAASHWQVYGDQSCQGELYYDSGEVGAFTSFMVPLENQNGEPVLQYGKPYWWRVKYRDSRGAWSEWSNPTSFTPVRVPPPAPAGLSASSGNRSVTLAWNAVQQAVGYYVYFAPEGESFACWNSEPVGSTNCTVTGLVNGRLHRFRVSAIDGAGLESPLSAEVSAVPQAPFRNRRTVETPVVRDLDKSFMELYKLYIDGRMVRLGLLSQNAVRFECLFPGLYFMDRDAVLALGHGLAVRFQCRI
ncbi:fibronectin type III domain-containing protein [Desulforudis sp. 1031]|uniref:fibronectin type III domain-containing protein n=2 Tax=Candidatus Desulforudis TaxID=471826 RepID=UPI003CE4A5BB